jgi:hypothetical protein
MEHISQHSSTSTHAPSPTGAGETTSAPALLNPKPERTWGLHVVDATIYGINALVVTGGSMIFTYYTQYGDKEGGDWGAKIYSRGEGIKAFFMNHLGMDHKQAKAMNTVAWSFADGTFFTPFVWGMEQMREKAAQKIDEWLGTVPEDLSVYAAEPKQTLQSVIGGRLATMVVVLPIAISMGKLGTEEGRLTWNTTPDNPNFTSMNDYAFHKPGKALGETLKAQPPLAGIVDKINIPALASIGLFEAFYTAVCSVTQRGLSRVIATEINHSEKSDPFIPATSVHEIQHIPLTQHKVIPTKGELTSTTKSKSSFTERLNDQSTHHATHNI